LLVAALAAWYALGYLPRLPEVAAPTTMPPPGDAFPGLPAIPEPHRLGPVAPSQPAELPALPRPAAAPDWRVAFSFTGSVRHELAVGTAVGLAIWLGVLLVLLLLAGLVSVLGGDEALPQQPPAMVLWIAALPLPARVAIALSAGLVEEVFFRAFLQPRAGVLLSTVLFALAHLGYGQPFMLVGVTLLSLLYAELIRRRSSVWAPVAAHAVFDLVQLVVVVPLVARALEHREATEAAAALLDAVFAL
jgi:membrane protease YdiL (CAAX protease family)